MSRPPVIAWPAPCLPAFLTADGGFSALAGAAEHEALATWARSLALVDRRRDRRIALAVERIEACDGELPASRAHALAELTEMRRLAWFRIQLRASQPLEPEAPRTAAVYDLVHGGGDVRRNAAAILAPGRALRIAFASDVHVARVWDRLDEAVARHAPDLHPAFLHPGRQLARFVEEANRLTAAGELDLVVFGGDLVDHVHAEGRGLGANDGANVRLFADAVARLDAPAVAIPGNHDFRLYPWRPRLPNLGSVGLPRSRARRVLRAAGMWDRWPLRPGDRDALATEEADGRSALATHLQVLAPATDFSLDLRGLRLVFASTGRDVVPLWRDLDPPRRRLLPRTLPSSLEHPDSEGLHDEQVRWLAAAVEGAAAVAVFLHAPLLHTGRPAPIERGLERLDPGEGDDLAARVAFERRLLAAGVRRGVLYRNPGPLLRAMLGTRGPVVSIAGHIHRGTAAVIDRRTLAVRSAPMAAPAAADDILSLFTAPSLGQRRYRAEESQPPGYVLARFEGGRLAAMEQCDLLAPRRSDADST